jgi:hypothetical protein
MTNDRIAHMVGNSKVFNMKGNPVDHCCHKTAGMAKGINEAEEDIAESLIGKHKR